MVDINLGDADAWDDSALVDSWNDALKEYKKYHSIHVKGQKLSDVLTKEELQLLSSNGLKLEELDGKLQEQEQEEEQASVVHSESYNEQPARDLMNGVDQTGVPSAKASDHVPPTFPQGLLNSVTDEGVKNLMMSWYWAGYYTGFHEGQNSAKNEV